MKTPALALLLSSLAAQALAAPCDPGARPEDRRAQLAAMTDADKRATALSRAGLSQLPDGRWSSMNGGLISELPLPTALNRAFDAYCSLLAQEAQAAARAARAIAATGARAVHEPTPPTPAPAAAAERRVNPSRISQVLAVAGGLFGSGAAPAEETAPPAAAAVPDCAYLRSQVESCDGAGMGDNNLPSDFKCRKARKDAAAYCR
ncbi:MAG: hypothetical protein SF051_08760 [Elusimicrobiota bacterium]|nr:hypothetical protein [Elusimicrobiota bacterium]